MIGESDVLLAAEADVPDFLEIRHPPAKEEKGGVYAAGGGGENQLAELAEYIRDQDDDDEQVEEERHGAVPELRLDESPCFLDKKVGKRQKRKCRHAYRQKQSGQNRPGQPGFLGTRL